MDICFLLHFYQPHDQQSDILERIVNESYRPILQGLYKRPHAKLVVNINGGLISLLKEQGYTDVLDTLKKLIKRGQVEITTSAMYHAFLPLIPKNEISRQIDLNTKEQIKAFGNDLKINGFFSPEMAISDIVIDTASKQNMQWIAAPSLSLKDGNPSSDVIYKYKDLNILFRNKRVSSLILSAVTRDAQTLIRETTDLHNEDKYWFCVMDAETFGHHRIGLEELLFDILDNKFFNPVTAIELINKGLAVKEASIRPCTWTNTEQDFHLKDGSNSFILWKDPSNTIHETQWEFTNFVIKSVNNYKDKSKPNYKKARKLLDTAIASDQFWWASVKPWWSLEMIEQGAFSLLTVVKTLYVTENKNVSKAESYYRTILDKAFYWQRSGYVRQKHLENSSTHMKDPFSKRAPAEWFNQIVLEFEDEMNKASKNRDFERAIKWRDALLKIKQNTDIYDVLHVVDELWSARKIPELKPFLEHDYKEFSDFAKDNFRDVNSEKDFRDWQKKKRE